MFSVCCVEHNLSILVGHVLYVLWRMCSRHTTWSCPCGVQNLIKPVHVFVLLCTEGNLNIPGLCSLCVQRSPNQMCRCTTWRAPSSNGPMRDGHWWTPREIRLSCVTLTAPCGGSSWTRSWGATALMWHKPLGPVSHQLAYSNGDLWHSARKR